MSNGKRPFANVFFQFITIFSEACILSGKVLRRNPRIWKQGGVVRKAVLWSGSKRKQKPASSVPPTRDSFWKTVAENFETSKQNKTPNKRAIKGHSGGVTEARWWWGRPISRLGRDVTWRAAMQQTTTTETQGGGALKGSSHSKPSKKGFRETAGQGHSGITDLITENSRRSRSPDGASEVSFTFKPCCPAAGGQDSTSRPAHGRRRRSWTQWAPKPGPKMTFRAALGPTSEPKPDLCGIYVVWLHWRKTALLRNTLWFHRPSASMKLQRPTRPGNTTSPHWSSGLISCQPSGEDSKVEKIYSINKYQPR